MNPYESPSTELRNERTVPISPAETDLRCYNRGAVELLVVWLIVTSMSLLLGGPSLFGRADIGVGYACVSVSMLSGFLFSIGSFARIILGIVLWKRVTRFPWGLAVACAILLLALATLGFGMWGMGPGLRPFLRRVL